ncbi:MAG: CsgG/HfaB family protein [Lamprobacter sp.]|uniref:CsgG/HfaB family protein n=1 Tax=Lamprobacter sp. TaxID=3100796 RepID=UPI002B25C7C9|nr:CsgG/HfaB family protein [Lamprobacter sp.]MEA3639796.1 CsgG/HfaB family protein [Lamprobacter sp.]
MTKLILFSVLALFSFNAPASNIVFAIMDFTTSDIDARKYLQHQDQQFLDEDEPVLSDAERALLSQEELAQIAKAQIQERAARNKEQRERLEQRNRLDRQEKADHRARTVSSALGREIIKAPDLLAAELSQYSDLFSIVDRRTVEEGVREINFQNSGLVSRQTGTQLGQMTGATHLVYGLVGDYGRDVTRSMAYNVPTKNTTHSIEIIVKVVEASTNKMQFSTIAQNSIQELKTGSGGGSNTQLMNDLLKGAIKIAAADIYERFSQSTAPDRESVEPAVLPKVVFEPKIDGQVIGAEIEIDGFYSGNAPATLSIPSGNHTIKFIYGDLVWERNIVVKDGMRISPSLR